MVGEVFDYVIVGAGSAGSTLAARLSEDPTVRIALIEAGANTGGFWSKIPLGVGRLLNDPTRVWKLRTLPDVHSNNISREWVSGKCLGGSSAVNGLVFVRGFPQMYDKWGEMCPGWSYEDCLPYFKRLENWSGPQSSLRGSGGPINVSFAEKTRLCDQFLKACSELGYAELEDYNAAKTAGWSYLQLSTKNGRRSGTAEGYLQAARARKNLVVIRGVTVQRVIFQHKRAIGVVANSDSGTLYINSRREVLLCAGAVRSPQLLELSGVGDPEHLAQYGIVPVVSNKAVGENLQDHLMVRSCFYTSSPDTINGMVFSSKKLVREIAKYIFTRRGFFSDASLKATLYAYSDSSKSVPDLRIQISLVSATDRIPESIREGLDPGSAFQIGVYGLYPSSRGSVHIQSTDVVDPPAVQPMYLSTDDDISALLSGLRIVKRLSSTAALGEVISSEIRPGPNTVADDTLLDYARTTGQTCWHPVGTCRMGPDGNSVVDIHCRVRGLAGLRVIDASVFPMLLSSNTNIPTIMLAEKIADQIRYGC